MHSKSTTMSTKSTPTPPNTPSATIVIPTLNEEQYLPALLNSLLQIQSPVEVIVVDGNSEDGTKSVVWQYQPQFIGPSSLRYIQSPRGISLQRNIGAAEAHNDVLIFCDADLVIPSEQVYSALLQEFTSKQYTVAAPRLIPIESGWNLRMFYWTFYVVQRILLLFGRPYFAGSCIITRKDTFNFLGGFDESIALGEDVDYSLRASKQGAYKFFTNPFPVSARRIIKYGTGWVGKEIPNLVRFLLTGRAIPDTIYYPFGGFSGAAEHHVTNNKGTISSI